MEYYIKIMPKRNLSTISIYAYNKGICDLRDSINITFLTRNKDNIEYLHGGYVEIEYPPHEYRYIVYENLPNFGHRIGQFKTIQEATTFVETLT